MKLRFCFSLGPLLVFHDSLEGLFFCHCESLGRGNLHPEFSSGSVFSCFYTIGIIVFVIVNSFHDLHSEFIFGISYLYFLNLSIFQSFNPSILQSFNLFVFQSFLKKKPPLSGAPQRRRLFPLTKPNLYFCHP